MTHSESPDRGLLLRLGPVTVDLPRTLGYYGAIAIAVTAGVIEPPLGLFIAAVPLAKMLTTRLATTPVRFIGQVFEGASQPVGGDGQGTIRLDTATTAHALPASTPNTRRPPNRNQPPNTT